MSDIGMLEVAALRTDQLWYVAHPVHPTDEDVEAYRAREDEVFAWHRTQDTLIGKSLGFVVEHRKSDREVQEQVIRDNVANAKAWLVWLVRRFPTITFIAPWIAAIDEGGSDDLDPDQRARGLRDCCRTVRVCCGIVLVGGRVSSGMAQESEHALNVVDLTSLGRVPPSPIREETT